VSEIERMKQLYTLATHGYEFSALRISLVIKNS
jgi:hypothetical protein